MPLAQLALARRAGIRHFGVNVPYTLGSGGPAFTIRGVFQEAYAMVPLGEGGGFAGIPAQLSTGAPKLGIDQADFIARRVAAGHASAVPAQGDRLEHGGVTYSVIDVRPDIDGGLDLILHRA